MLLKPWLSFLTSQLLRSPRNLKRRSAVASRVERLEDRTLLSYVSAISTNPGGAVSMTGDGTTDTLTLSIFSLVGDPHDGDLMHNTITSFNGGTFFSDFDFDSTLPGEQALSAAQVTTLSVQGGGANNHTINLGPLNLPAATALAINAGNGPNVNTTVNLQDRISLGGAASTATILADTVNANVDSGLVGAAISTRSNQTYSPANGTLGINLQANTSFASNGAGTITFNGDLTSDGSVAGSPFDLAVNDAGGSIVFGNVGGTNTIGNINDLTATAAGGTVTFNAVVGGISPSPTAIGSVTTTAGTTAINGGFITTTNAQTYNGSVTLGNGLNAALTSEAGGNLTFTGTVNNNGASASGLTVSTAGTTFFNGSVGGTSPLASLTSTAGGRVQLNNASVTTVTTQTYGNPVLLGATTFFTSTGNSDITFQNSVNSIPGLALGPAVFITTGGATTFNGPVGTVGAPLSSISTDVLGTTQINGGVIQTSGFQGYGDAVNLGASTLLSVTAGGSINFGSTVNGQVDLTINNASVVTMRFVGNVTPLTSLIINGALSNFAVAGATVTTSGNQTYGGGVLLSATPATLTSNNGNLLFNGSVVGVLDSSGNRTGTLTVQTNSANGTITFNQIIGLVALNTGGFGTTIFNTPVVANLTTGQFGATVFNFGSQVVGTTVLNNPVTLGANILFSGTTTLNSSMNGAFNLTINGAPVINGPIGNATPLNSVTFLTPSGTGAIAFNGGLIETTGDQSYFLGSATLGADMTFTSLNGAIQFLGSSPTLAGNSHNLTINTHGFLKILGKNGLQISGVNNLSITGGGTIEIGATLNTLGGQLYEGPVLLENDTILTSGGGTGTGNIEFDATVDSVNGNRSLTVTTLGRVIFGDGVGADGIGTIMALGILTVGGTTGTAIAAPTLFNLAGTPGVPNVITTGAQVYLNDLQIAGNVTMECTQGGGLTGIVAGPTASISFARLVDSFDPALPGSLSLVSDGNILIGSGRATPNAPVFPVGSFNPLFSLTTREFGLGTGKTIFNVPQQTAGTAPPVPVGPTTVTTISLQRYSQPVVLAGDTTLTSTNTGDIRFDSTIDAQTAFVSTPGATIYPQSLRINTNAFTIFSGVDSFIGLQFPLETLTTDAGGTTVFQVADSTQGNSVLTNAPRNTVTTIGNQNYLDAVQFANDGMLHGQNILFDSTVNGPASLWLTSVSTPAQPATPTTGAVAAVPGVQTFNGAVGNTIPLESLTIQPVFSVVVTNPPTPVVPDLIGTLNVNGGLVRTRDFQTYNDTVVLGTSATFVSTVNPLINFGTGNISFNSAIQSSFNVFTPAALTVNSAGETRFGDGLGADYLGANIDPLDPLNNTFFDPTTGRSITDATQALASVTTDAAGSTIFYVQDNVFATVLTLGAQTYNDAVQVAGPTTLISLAGGDITFAGTINSFVGSVGDADSVLGPFGAFLFTPQPLTVDSSGNEIFDAPIGIDPAFLPLLSLATDESMPVEFFDFITGTTLTFVGGHAQFNFAGTISIPAVQTIGTQAYYDAVILSGNSVFTSTQNGTIKFNSTVDSLDAVPKALTVNTSGVTSFGDGFGNDWVGSAFALASVTVNSLPILTATGPTNTLGGVQFDVVGSTAANPTVKTIGSQSYNAQAVLFQTTVLSSTASGNVIFNGSVNSSQAPVGNLSGNSTAPLPQDLTVMTAGIADFGDGLGADNVGNLFALRNLMIGGGGTLWLNVAGSSNLAPSIKTTGFQTYSDAVSLFAGTVLTSTSSGNITFNSTVDTFGGVPGGIVPAPMPLAVNSLGNNVFFGSLGNKSALASLKVDTDAAQGAAGQTQFFVAGSSSANPTVKTTGDQTFNNAVVLGADTYQTSTAGGSIQFNSTVDSATATPSNLALSTIGNMDFGNGSGVYVGHILPLASVTTSGGGFTRFNVRGSSIATPTVTTTGPQTYNNPVILRADTVLTSTTGAAITLPSVSRGGFSLTLNPDPTAATNLAGYWVYNGKSVQIIQSGTKLTFVDPNRKSFAGSVTSLTQVSAPNLLGVKTLTGTLSHDKITFSNGAVWTKIDLTGTYYVNGKAVTVTQTGTKLVFVDQNGLTSAGQMLSPTQVSATRLYNVSNLKATISGGKILFANRVVWTNVPPVSGTANGTGGGTDSTVR